MPGWFDENSPNAQASGGWFDENAPKLTEPKVGTKESLPIPKALRGPPAGVMERAWQSLPTSAMNLLSSAIPPVQAYQMAAAPVPNSYSDLFSSLAAPYAHPVESFANDPLGTVAAWAPVVKGAAGIARSPVTSATLRGASTGAWEGATSPSSFKLKGVPVKVPSPSSIASGATGAGIGGYIGGYPGAAVGGAIGAVAPVVTGAVKGALKGYRGALDVLWKPGSVLYETSRPVPPPPATEARDTGLIPPELMERTPPAYEMFPPPPNEEIAAPRKILTAPPSDIAPIERKAVPPQPTGRKPPSAEERARRAEVPTEKRVALPMQPVAAQVPATWDEMARKMRDKETGKNYEAFATAPSDVQGLIRQIFGAAAKRSTRTQEAGTAPVPPPPGSGPPEHIPEHYREHYTQQAEVGHSEARAKDLAIANHLKGIGKTPEQVRAMSNDELSDIQRRVGEMTGKNYRAQSGSRSRSFEEFRNHLATVLQGLNTNQ